MDFYRHDMGETYSSRNLKITDIFVRVIQIRRGQNSTGNSQRREEKRDRQFHSMAWKHRFIRRAVTRGAWFMFTNLEFTQDGKSIAYTVRENGVDNVWVQPLSSSPGHPITDFKSEQIWSFRLSPDGKSLAVLRGHFDSDVVLLQEFKP
jgi:hypothetical protein